MRPEENNVLDTIANLNVSVARDPNILTCQ